MRIFITATFLMTITPVVWGHGLFIFPNNDQNQNQQDQDEMQCMRAARDQSGFDPMATPTATSALPQTQGGLVRGAGRGAVLGAAVGSVSGDTRQGARYGAAGGGVFGGMRRADSNQQQQQWAREQSLNYQNNRNSWNRAFTACMESRGYTVR
jgi:hypothetical protein